MKEIRTIIEAYQNIDFSKTKAALVTVVGLEGSSYRRRGARMLVLDDGNYLGGISGGCLEGDALKRAKMAILKEKPSIVTYDTTQKDDHQIGVGLGCNGVIDILFTPLDPNDQDNPVLLLSSILKTRQPRILITITGSSHEMLGKTFLYNQDMNKKELFPDEQIANELSVDINKTAQTLISSNITYSYKDQNINFFIEVILPEIKLVIFGSNHDIYSTGVIAKELGWEIIYFTHLAKASKKLFEIADHVYDMKTETLHSADEYTAIVLMTHDYNTDLDKVGNLLKTNASYIGILGPKNRAERLFAEIGMDYNNLNPHDRNRIFAPTGLDIGATTPEEIALSIIAEIKTKFANRSAGFLKLRSGSINEIN